MKRFCCQGELASAVFFDGANAGEVKEFLKYVATVGFHGDWCLEVVISQHDRLLLTVGEWVTIDSEGDVFTYESDFFPMSFTEDKS